MKSLRFLSELAWRGLVIAFAVLAIVFALVRLKVVVLPLGIALLFVTFLIPAVGALERRGLKRWMATAIVFLTFLTSVVLVILLVAPPLGEQFGELGDTIEQGVDDIEEWLAEGPLELSQDQIEEYRTAISDYARTAVRSSGDQIIAGAVLVAEFLTGSFLTLLAIFFILKDGPKIQAWVLAHLPAQNRDVVSACAARAWNALGGFLRGAAIIGLFEGFVIGLALALVGADLALPVAVLTFFAAFFPVVGAVFAGIVATIVALVSGGVADAAVIALVALIVQQFDNDLLSPVIYGRALRLHPLVVISALTAGGVLGGIIGAFLAVPVTAVTVAIAGELWRRGIIGPSALEGEGTEPLEGAAQ